MDFYISPPHKFSIFTEDKYNLTVFIDITKIKHHFNWMPPFFPQKPCSGFLQTIDKVNWVNMKIAF